MSAHEELAIRSDAEYVLGIHDFEGRSEDELSLNKGDHIEVIETDKAFGDGWFVGRNLRTQKAGLFPKIFTTDLILPKSPTRQASFRTNSSKNRASPPVTTNSTAPLVSPTVSNPPPTTYGVQPQSHAAHRQQKSPKQAGLMEPFMMPTHSASNTPPSRIPTSAATRDAPRKYSVHDTLTDIDAAISEINAAGKYHSNVPHHQDSRNGAANYMSYSEPNPYLSRNSSSSPGYPSAPKITPQPRSATPDPAKVTSWSPYDVKNHLLAKGYPEDVAGNFVEHKITGPILLELDLAYLKEIGIHTFGTRFELSREIKHLNSMASYGAGQHRDLNGSRKTSGTDESLPATAITPRTTSLGKIASPPAHHHRTNSNSDGVEVISTGEQDVPRLQAIHKRDSSFNQNWTHPVSTSSNDGSSSWNKSSSHDVSWSGGGEIDTGPTDSGYGASINNNKSQTPVSTNTNANNDDSSSDAASSVSLNGKGRRTEEILTRTSSGLIHSALRGPMSPTTNKTPTDHSRQPSRDTVRAGSEPSRQSFYGLGGKHTRSTSSVAMGGGFHARIGSDASAKQHRRHSSILSFMRTEESQEDIFGSTPAAGSPDLEGSRARRNIFGIRTREKRFATVVDEPPDPDIKSSPSVPKLNQRSTSSSGPVKKLSKQKTSAFTEGIQKTTAEESAKLASYSGWMHKKGGGSGVVGTWKNRYFTLHGTRLSYFGTLEDVKEKGLIDITAHKVLPARENEDKFVAIYAASIGAGRHCFKLVPPAPGYRKGVTFTAPKVHYFAVDSKEEMRAWMAALMKATIDRDDTVPVESTFTSATLPLPRAQELFAEARAREEDLRAKMVAGGLYNQRFSKNSSPALANQSPVFPISTPIAQSAPAFPISTPINQIPPAFPISTPIDPSTSGSSPDLARPSKGNLNPTTPDSPTGSSLGSSRTGSSATNTSSVKVALSTTISPDTDSKDKEMRHLNGKTAGLKINTNIHARE